MEFDICFVSVFEVEVRGTMPVCQELTFRSLAQAAEPVFAAAEVESWVSEALCESVREAA